MPSVPDVTGALANDSGPTGRCGTDRMAMSMVGSYDTTVASYGLPLASTVTLFEPATTCALVMTRSGESTNPLPSNTFEQDGAIARIFTTLGSVFATTGFLDSAASGAATATTGVRLNGSSTCGSPEVSSNADNRLGTVL